MGRPIDECYNVQCVNCRKMSSSGYYCQLMAPKGEYDLLSTEPCNVKNWGECPVRKMCELPMAYQKLDR